MTTKFSRFGSLSRRHALGALLAPFAVSALGSAAAAATLDEIKKRGYLVVATEDDFRPFEFVKDGKPTGFDNELLDDLRKFAPFEVKQEIIPWTGLLAGVSTGKYDVALTAVREAVEIEPSDEMGSPRTMPELIEAAVRSGEHRLAGRALVRLAQSTRSGDTDWGLGLEARSRALLSDGDVVRLCANRGALDVLAELSGREPAQQSEALQGTGRELFAMFRLNAGGAEQGGSAMLEMAGL